MKFKPYPYTGIHDLPAMRALACAFPDENLRRTDLPYRFSSWALDDADNAALWRDENGSLVGWAILQRPFWSVDYAYHPLAGEELHRQILEWADARARAVLNTPYSLPCWFVTAFAGQDERIATLEAAGFACQADVGEDSWSKVWLRRPAGLPVKEYRIPAGFTIRSLAGEAEVEAYVELHQTVFGTKNMTAAWRSRSLRQPEYRPDLDVVVQAPDGRLAAFCIGWLNRTEGQPVSGQVEPLGCRAEFRRYALGRVALAEVLRRLQAAGAGDIFVETDNYRDTAWRLYENVGFEKIRDILIFRKDYGDEAG